MKQKPNYVKLSLLDYHQYRGVNQKDPIRFYYWPLIGRLYRKRVEMCLSKCKGGERVLEVGFGTGLSFLNLKELYPEIFGIDLDAAVDQVRNVFEDLGVSVDLRNGNVLNMPFSDAHFDTVLLISILEHLKPAELEKAFAEIRRVLKPGGQVVFGVPVERPLMAAIFRLIGVNIREHHFSTHDEVLAAAKRLFPEEPFEVETLEVFPMGKLYQVGSFQKPDFSNSLS
jgi:ubiquinone/menaquinone biosynthesis C-methylase UbiE